MSRLDFSEVQNLSAAICQDRSFQTAGNSAKFPVDNVAVSSFLVTRHYRSCIERRRFNFPRENWADPYYFFQ
jgi:hypothetical protein